MDDINTRLEKAKAASRQKAAAPLDAQDPAPAATTTTSSVVLAKQKTVNRTRGALAENFVSQIGLHALTYPEWFPNDSSKVAFAISFLTDYTATWAQLYTTKLFAGTPIAFLEFLNDFKASFFDLNHKHQAKVTLQSIRQTGTV
ncbi:hypothetical protein PCANC_05917 [Puccinia coronata f. sp. avenae]|uniref:Retrotransposon gag domain-containing protein n=1 Tax=Puccinia coronata f. sp. avenae TaxID=200324 RepID=A0A2N5VY51_9BASI|nr:hypothetical protein PCANC_05917 [Puccinia coronata f. sp. avenae]